MKNGKKAGAVGGMAMVKICRCLAAGLLVAGLLSACMAGGGAPAPGDGAAGGAAPQTASTWAMDTMVTQQAWGDGAAAAMRQVNLALAEQEARLSMFGTDGDIARVNAAAGTAPVTVQPQTAALLRRAVELSAQSEGVYAITVAPLTRAWGITTEEPRVPPDGEIAALLPLVDDSRVELNGDAVFLPQAGMGIDLGGIAKGAACAAAAEIYAEHGVDSAWLNIGGNVYAHGRKPDGSRFRVGFEDPFRAGDKYIASFELEDAVVAVSGGYNRFFEVEGTRYIHILDPRTGRPAESDVVSVGVIHPDGAVADFYSTTLFLWGRDRALAYMRAGGQAVLLDEQGTLYVSEDLKDGFALAEPEYALEFVPAG